MVLNSKSSWHNKDGLRKTPFLNDVLLVELLYTVYVEGIRVKTCTKYLKIFGKHINTKKNIQCSITLPWLAL